MVMDSNETIKQAVIAGLGIAHFRAVATELDERRLVTLDLEACPWSGNGSCLAQDKVPLPPAQAMRDFLSAGAPSSCRAATAAFASPALGPRRRN